ncbi:MAG: sodium ion-translocating decarboxylase subunit beta [Pirellulales bacterium]|nr:sodium ion-translocating decarboxylase subunit beta [Pirellulales bacterium]
MGNLLEFFQTTGFATLSFGNVAMIVIGITFITLAIRKHYEPLLLVPIGMGIIVGNIPFSEDMQLGVENQGAILVEDGKVLTDPIEDSAGTDSWMLNPLVSVFSGTDDESEEGGGDAAAAKPARFRSLPGSVLGYLYFGVSQGIFPPLIFLGIGAMTDFSTMLSNPRLVMLGAAAQIGVFLTFLGALYLGFGEEQAGAVGIIGGADGPTAIFLSAKLAPGLLGAIAIAAYSYMALVPVIQPPIMKLLTTQNERKIRMKPPREVSKAERIVFPIAAFLICTLLAPGALVLIGMLFFGNLLKECGVTDRLAQSARTSMIDIVTILLGFSVGASTAARNFLQPESLLIFGLGATAFAVATAGGVLFAKLMNVFLKEKINPLVGAAGVSAVPDSARVVEMVGLEEDPENHLLMHAMAPNVAGVLGSAVAAGILWSALTN